jgi:mono/diheme cytochrome c family protein
MLSRRFVLVLVGVVISYNLLSSQRAATTTSAEQLQHGEYLVLHVAMCVQCHTPRDQEGRLESTRLLQGAPMPVQSPFPSSPWAFQAPALAGLPGWTAAEAITFLQTGKRADGSSPRPPMPPFRFTQEDAMAIVAYLQALPSRRPERDLGDLR